MSAFHAYDIRGIYNTDFNKEDVYKIGYFLPGILNAKKVLVGRDVRLSSPEIYETLVRGITDTGADVFDAGLTTTPMIYWGTAKYDFPASVMITASHNPANYNGLKVSAENALPVGYDSGLKMIEDKIKAGEAISFAREKGKIETFDFRNDYVEFQKSFLKKTIDLKIAVDCSNGMAGLLTRDILGENPIYINEAPDGSFPNHDPNPLNQKNLKQLQQAVLDNQCDIGVIFDGDADRVMFVDENGKFISPDLIIGLLGHYFLSRNETKENVLQDIRTSKAVKEYIEAMGGNMHMWRVGRAYAALKLREIDGLFGGELAGHYYFRDFYYSDSAFLASTLVLQIISDFKKQGMAVSEIIAKIGKYANSGEINFKIEDKDLAMEKIKNHFLREENPNGFYNFDGYRIEFAEWWFSIRKSNTEPYLRLLVEANSAELMKKKVSKIKELLNANDKHAGK